MAPLNFVKDIRFHQRVPRQDLVHYLLGNGKLQAVIQVTKNPSCRNALVLHLMHPERFRTKSNSFTFHQQIGPEMTLVGLIADGDLYVPNPKQTSFDLEFGLNFEHDVPLFTAKYPADYTIDGKRKKSAFRVKETFLCPIEYPALLRRITVTNARSWKAQSTKLLALFVPNQILFPEAHYLTELSIATAGDFEGGDELLGFAGFDQPGSHQVNYFPVPIEEAIRGVLEKSTHSYDDANYVKPQETYTNYPLLPGSPHLGSGIAFQYDLGELKKGESRSVDLIYAYGSSEEHISETIRRLRAISFEAHITESRRYWTGINAVESGNPQLDHYYQAARVGLRASVGDHGYADACIWGFNAEWVRDSSLASVGATYSGQFSLAQSLLEHILTHLVNPQGMTYGESRFYDLQHFEPDQNGELLYALWEYWAHSRDDSLIKAFWEKIVAVAELPLLPDFWVEGVSMVKSERDIRERDKERHGMEEGFELAYQVWVSLGLQKAADMAAYLGDGKKAKRWRSFARRIWDAVLNHPRYQLVENGYLMKRRVLEGSFQRTAHSAPYVHRVYEDLTKMYPRDLNRSGELEPDHSEVYPIALGLLDPNSEIAQHTLKRMELIWNQEWDFGGYPLHNVESEPTKLGGHMLPIQLITQAALETRHYDIVRRNLKWLTQDYWGNTWWEYRDADPELQIDHGIPFWFSYGEPIVFFMRHLLGYRPDVNNILIRPNPLPEMVELKARVRCGDCFLSLSIHNKGRHVKKALIDGVPAPSLNSREVHLNIPSSDQEVEIWLTDRER